MTNKDQKEQPTNPKDLIATTKVNVSLVPPSALIGTSLALMYGATQYGPYNIRTCGKVGYMTYLSADIRHTLAFLDGENDAQDSLLPHLYHKMGGIAMLIDAIETGRAIDDRPEPGIAAKMLDDWNKRLPELMKRWQDIKDKRTNKTIVGRREHEPEYVSHFGSQNPIKRPTELKEYTADMSWLHWGMPKGHSEK